MRLAYATTTTLVFAASCAAGPPTAPSAPLPATPAAHPKTLNRHGIVVYKTKRVMRIHGPEKMIDPIECRTADDCGQRAHARKSWCEHDGSCHVTCEDYWGDCNKDYRDGCEVRIEHVFYCPNDPMLNHVDPPSISYSTGAVGGEAIVYQEGDERYGWQALEDRLEELIPCYDAVLDQNPKAEGFLDYAVTLDPKGRSTNVALTESSGKAVEGLRSCSEELLMGFDFKEPRRSYLKQFEVRFILTPEMRARDYRP